MPNKQDEKSSPKKVEGEGSYEGTRRYNEHVKDFAKSGQVDKAADEAKHAIDGAEKKQLDEAVEQGKRGPKH